MVLCFQLRLLARHVQYKGAQICAVVPDTERLWSTKGREAKGKGAGGGVVAINEDCIPAS